jgi:hypothetical protein
MKNVSGRQQSTATTSAPWRSASKTVKAIPTADIQETPARQIFGKSKPEIIVLKLGELVCPRRDSTVAQVNAMPPAETLEVGSLPGGRLSNTLSKRRITHLIQSGQPCYQFDMRIALDGIPLVAAKTGVGHYTNSLATWLARTHEDHQYELLTPFDFEFESRNGHGASNLNKHFIRYDRCSANGGSSGFRHCSRFHR